MSRTAFTSPQLALLRTHPQALIGMGLAVHRPAMVCEGHIDSVPSFPANGTGVGQFTYTQTGGDFNDIREGMTIYLYSSSLPTYPTVSYTLRGGYVTYVRKAPTSGTMYINALGKQTTSASYFRVIDEYLPKPRRRRYDSGSGLFLANFDTAYSDQNSLLGPQAIMGCSAVKYKNGSVTFDFDGSRSVAHTPGSSIASYTWEFPDGSTATGAAATWATSTAYQNGAYFHLTVEDDDGVTHTGHRLLFKFDSSNKPLVAGPMGDFSIESLEGEWPGGWEARVTLNDPYWGYTNAQIPSRRCVLFYNVAYGSTVGEIGGNFPNRENILLDGWATEDNIVSNVNGSQHTITISTVHELMAVRGFPVSLDDAATATSWLEMDELSLDKAGWHFCRWLSTVGDVVDIHFAATAASEREKKFVDMQSAGLWAQLEQLCSWVMDGRVSCDAQSAIYCEQDYGTNRSLSPVTMCGLIGTSTSSPSTFLRENWERQNGYDYILKTAKFEAYGVDFDQPIGSRAPDDPIAEGAERNEIASGLAHTQSEMNTYAGNHRSQLDRLAVSRFLPLNGIIRIDPTPQCLVNIDVTEQAGLVRHCAYTFDLEHGMAYTTLQVEPVESAWPAGVTIDFDL